MKLTFLHISDIHLSENSKADQSVVLKALFADIEKQRKGGVTVDAILWSGDLVAKGRYTASLDRWVLEDLIPGLLKASQVPGDRLFLVPGNHDVETNKRDAVLHPVFHGLSSRGLANELVRTASERPFLWGHIHAFNSLRDRVHKATPALSNVLYQAFAFSKDGVRIGIGCINSAWKATGAPHDEDYGKLVVSEHQVEDIAAHLKDCQIRVAVMHHPLEWLATFDKPGVHRALMLDFDALFHGHNHNSDAVTAAHATRGLFVSNAGCLYQTREYFNGYSLVQFDSEVQQWNVVVREYYDQRRCFDASPRFAPGGAASFPAARNEGQRAILRLPTEQYLTITGQKLDVLLLSNVSDIAPKKLGAIFVEPVLGRSSERGLGATPETDGESGIHKLADLFNTPRPTLILGRRESGRTTLLAYLCANATNPDISQRLNHGIYVNLESLRTYTRATLLEAMVAFSSGELSRQQLVELLDLGQVTLCLDNLQLRDGKELRLVRDFLKEFPKNKFIISSVEDLRSALTKESIPSLGVDVDIAFIHSFGRRHTRQLVQKWFGESPEIVREHSDSALRLLRRLNIPRSPFLLSILLWIQERGISFQPVNQAALTDAFIDGLLEKLRESKQRGALDITIKRHFLGELALHLHRENNPSLSKNALEAFTVQYFTTKMLPVSALSLLEELYDKGVLLDMGDEVTFKFDCFRSFFLATKLGATQELLTKAMSPESFHELYREIDLFTGLHRDRKDFLERFIEILEDAHKPVSLELPLSVFDDIGTEGSPLSVEKKDMILSEVLNSRPSFDQQENLLDELDEKAQELTRRGSGKDQTRTVVLGGPYTKFIAALRMCSIVLRNSELVDDAELKARAYSLLLSRWSEVLIGAVLAIDVSNDPVESPLSPILKDLPPDAAKHLTKLLIAFVILGVIRESLATPKLETVMISHVELSQHNVEHIIDTFLYADLDLPKFVDRLEQLTERIDAKFELEVVFLKLLTMLTMKHVSDDHAKRLAALLAKTLTKTGSGGTKSLDEKLKQQFLTKVKRLGLIERMSAKH